MDYTDLDLDVFQYKLFYLVCKNRSFSKTAHLLGVTQPSVSYNIKKLEEFLGVKLFERGNVLTLTPEAEALLPYVEESINSLKKGQIKVNELINLARGQISIGVPSHVGVFLLTDILKKFNKEYPNIKIRVTCKPTVELFRLLNTNDLDVVIDCSPLDENTSGLEIIKISSEKCVLCCNKINTKLLNKVIKLQELSNYSLIVPARTSGSTKELIKVYNEHGVLFEPIFEIATSDMIADMVENNMGIGYLFEKTVIKYPNLRIIDLEETLPIFDIFMIYKDYLLSSTVKTFINFVREKN